jgi:hypothetical protein
MGDRPIFFGRGPILGKLFEQPFLSILPKNSIGCPLIHFWISCWRCSKDDNAKGIYKIDNYHTYISIVNEYKILFISISMHGYQTSPIPDGYMYLLNF